MSDNRYIEPDWLDVSRETLDQLQLLCDLVRKWNPAVNLISRASEGDLWSRHVLDSAQIYMLAEPGADCWVDLGSGGGFPGLVVAVLAKQDGPAMRTVLVESDRRKAVFLAQAIRTLNLNASVSCERIEAIAPLNAAVLSARALAPLRGLCGFADLHLRSGGTAIFHKGVAANEELADARLEWMFSCNAVKSHTDPDASILLLRDIKHV
jgi:16S rRNA (guanine527-N7)-methyltransferase